MHRGYKYALILVPLTIAILFFYKVGQNYDIRLCIKVISTNGYPAPKKCSVNFLKDKVVFTLKKVDCGFFREDECTNDGAVYRYTKIKGQWVHVDRNGNPISN